MILQIVAVRDRAADAFGRPVFAHTVGQAIRSFQDEINRVAPDNEMNKHPSDFDLWHLGEFEDNSGKLLQTEPKQLAIGANLIQTK